MRDVEDGVTEAEGPEEIEQALADVEGENVVHMSPAPRAKDPDRGIDTMDFGAALRAVVAGVSVRRLSWPDADVLFLRGNIVHLRKADGSEHGLLTADADIMATDWTAVA